MAAIDNTLLPDDPSELFERIGKAEDPWRMALKFGRELMQLTEPEKKNFWFLPVLRIHGIP